MKKNIGLAGLLALSACGAPTASGPVLDANTITFNDFEAGGGWSGNAVTNNPALVFKGKAHSGQYALRVDKDHEFSYTFDMPLGLIRLRKFRVVHLEAWAYLPSERASAAIGLQVMRPDGQASVFGDDLKLVDAVKSYQQWVKVEKDFTLPDDIKLAQHLRVFLWRASASEEALLDDVQLRIKD